MVEELVGVGGEPEIDHAAGGIERDAARFERAQICDGDRQDIGELLRLRAAGIVDHPPVRRPQMVRGNLAPARSEIAALKIGDQVAPGRCGCRRRTAAAPIGSKPKRMSVAAGAMPRRFTRAASNWPGFLGLRAEIEVERYAGVEMHAVERARDRLLANASRP